MLRESRLGNRYQKWVDEVPVPFFLRLSLSPNHLTGLALLVGLATIPAYGYALWLGGIGVLCSGFLDTMDGGLARKAARQTPSGAFLDSVLDRYSDFSAILGIWLYSLFHPVGHQTLLTLLLFLYLMGAFMVSYSRARGEGLGISAQGGWFGRAERVICLGVGSLFNDLLVFFLPAQAWAQNGVFLLFLLGLLTVGTHLTALQRILSLLRRLG